MILDIHTHHLPVNAHHAIFSWHPGSQPIPTAAVFLSIGIHPWFLAEETYLSQKERLIQQLNDNRIIAIGEAGLDKCCTTPFDLQIEAFRFCALLAEKKQLPLIIHAVKSHNELIALKKTIQPQSPWIIHGFRGKKELAVSLVRQGFYLSFGEKYQEDALKAIPLQSIILETDESNVDIYTLYTRAAQLRHILPATFILQVQETIKNLFFKT